MKRRDKTLSDSSSDTPNGLTGDVTLDQHGDDRLDELLARD